MSPLGSFAAPDPTTPIVSPFPVRIAESVLSLVAGHGWNARRTPSRVEILKIDLGFFGRLFLQQVVGTELRLFLRRPRCVGSLCVSRATRRCRFSPASGRVVAERLSRRRQCPA
jgi:hypothetical protein